MKSKYYLKFGEVDLGNGYEETFQSGEEKAGQRGKEKKKKKEV